MFPVLFEIPNAWSQPGGWLVLEIVVLLASGLAWLALYLRGSRGWAATTLNTVAVLLVLHLALSWFMGKDSAITIYSFGVVIIIGFLVGARFMLGQTRPLGLEDKKVFDWAFWMLVVGIVGSRFLYAYLNYDQFSENKLEIFRIWNGGLVWYGGLIPAAIVGFWLLHRYKLPMLNVMDLGGCAVILALGIGRWACFLAGDDYGLPTDSWIGIRFYDPRALVPTELRGVALHPTQLYMSVNCLWLFFACEWIRRRAKWAGQAFAWMLILYAVSRAAWIEPFRGDFIERNPGYGKHLAAEVVIDKDEGSPAVALERGAVVRGRQGRTGQLLEPLQLPAGKAFGSAHAISDEPAKAVASGPLGVKGPPDWNIASVEGLPAAVTPEDESYSRWYRSDLPRPPSYVSTSQWISVFMVLVGVAMLLGFRKLNVPGYTAAREAAESAEDADDSH